MARPHPLLVHPILTSLLALVCAAIALLEIGGPPVEIEGGRAIGRWYLVVTFAMGAVGLALAALASWKLLGVAGPESVAGPLRMTRMAWRWALGMLAAGPAVSLIGVRRTGSWSPLGLAVFAAGLFFLPCALMPLWQLRRIVARKRS